MRLIVSLLIAACCTLQVQAEEVEWLPRWSAGDSASYEVERCKQRRGAGNPQSVCGKGRIEIEVLHADVKGSTQRWTFDTPMDGLIDSQMPAELRTELLKTAHVAMDIEFDDVAQPVRLVNADAIRARMRALTDAMLKMREGARPLDSKVADGVRKLMAQMMGSDASVLSLAAKDAHLLYSPLGGSFALNQPASGRSTMPSPFGDHPIESTLEITARMTSGPAPELVLEVDETIDRESFLALMEQVLLPTVRASGKPGAEDQARKAFASVSISRRAVYFVTPGNPWARQVNWVQTAESEGAQAVETVTLKRSR